MREYQIREDAPLFPHRCFLTETGHGPFVDTFVDREEIGRLYVSLRAVSMMAPLCGFVAEASLEEANTEIARLREYVRTLENDLERERSPEGKVITVADLMASMRSGDDTPAAA